MSELSKRNSVRLASFITAAAVVLVAFAANASYERNLYRRQLEYTYMRSLQDAADFVSNISVSLDKGMYAGTPAQMTGLSATLWKDSSAAKASLSSLPVSQFELGNTYKFLAQVGDYSMALTRKVQQNQQITDEEKENFKKLRDYAYTLNDQLAGIERQLRQGQLTLEQIQAEAQQVGNGADQPAEGEDDPAAQVETAGFKEMSDEFSGYPKLIYDGPFSDHILEREPELTKHKAMVTREQARSLAAKAAGVAADTLEDMADEASKMPCYNFQSGQKSVSVTKNGGLLNYMVDGRIPGEVKIEDDKALQSAAAYLDKLGLKSLRKTYYEKSNNIMTINFAYYQDGVTCYTDLVQVGVALDDGSVVSFDARGYITNHRERELGTPKLSAEEAQKSVSQNLTVRQNKLALIPTSGLHEVLAYEFYGTGSGGDEMLVYVNADTGAEEQILKLIKSDTGTLTK